MYVLDTKELNIVFVWSQFDGGKIDNRTVLWDHYLALCMLALYSGMELMLMNANPVTGIVLR